MLVYFLGMTKQGGKGFNNQDRFQGLQIAARGNTNRSNLRDFKLGQKDYISGQGFQIRPKRSQVKAKITKWDKRDCKPGQGLRIGAEQRDSKTFPIER